MKNKLIIRNAKITNENKEFIGDIAIEDSFISEISNQSISGTFDKELDASNLLLVPGMIDDQVHFREPGLTEKANIFLQNGADEIDIVINRGFVLQNNWKKLYKNFSENFSDLVKVLNDVNYLDDEKGT